MEPKAQAATGKTPLRLDSAQLDVAGFNSGQWGSSVHGCQARVLQALGEELTYEQLIAYGGLAFRAQVHVAMCPSAAHPCCGYDCTANSNRALPYLRRVFTRFPWGPPPESPEQFEAEARQAVRESIDRGTPVHYSNEEDGLIIGYSQAGRRWRCVHPYYGDGREAFWYDQAEGFAGGRWPWALAVWTEPKPQPERTPPRELASAALAQAVDMWHAGRSGANQDYLTGRAAYDHWLDWLEGIDAGRVENPSAGMQGNGWCFDMLCQCRHLAAGWLENEAPKLLPEARQPLAEAAGAYRQLVATCMKGLECTWHLALPPTGADQWTPAQRAELIQRLGAARRCEAQAVEALAAAGAAAR